MIKEWTFCSFCLTSRHDIGQSSKGIRVTDEKKIFRNTNIGGDIPYSVNNPFQVMFLISWKTESNTAWSFWDNVYTATGQLWPTDVGQIVPNIRKVNLSYFKWLLYYHQFVESFWEREFSEFFQPSFFHLVQ